MKDVWFQCLHFRDHAENAHQLERTKSSSQQSAHVLHQVRGVLTFSSDWHRHSACASVCPALRSGVVRQTRVSMSSSQLDLGEEKGEWLRLVLSHWMEPCGLPCSAPVLEVPLHKVGCTVLEACQELKHLSAAGHLVVGAHQDWDLDVMEPVEELVLQGEGGVTSRTRGSTGRVPLSGRRGQCPGGRWWSLPRSLAAPPPPFPHPAPSAPPAAPPSGRGSPAEGGVQLAAGPQADPQCSPPILAAHQQRTPRPLRAPLDGTHPLHSLE